VGNIKIEKSLDFREKEFAMQLKGVLPEGYRMRYSYGLFGGWFIVRGGFWIFGKTIASLVGNNEIHTYGVEGFELVKYLAKHLNLDITIRRVR